MKLPSARIVLIAFACILVVGGMYIVFNADNTQDTYTVASHTATPDVLVAQNIKNSATTDGDGDGLMDWEEMLWKTDPRNNDSDNDGILDGKDVQQIPSEKNPSASGIQQTLNTASTPTNLTLTDKIAREAFTQYALLKQNGTQITPEIAQQVALNIISKQPLQEDIQKFTALHLTNVIPDSDDSIREYGNALWDIMLEHTPKNVQLENEYVVLLTALQKENPDYLKKLDPIIEGYHNTVTALIAMPVPQSAVQKHLDFVNSMNVILARIEDMRAYYTDTVRGLEATTYYSVNVLAFQKTTKQLISYFSEKGIEYVEGESGYLLTHSI